MVTGATWHRPRAVDIPAARDTRLRSGLLSGIRTANGRARENLPRNLRERVHSDMGEILSPVSHARRKLALLSATSQPAFFRRSGHDDAFRSRQSTEHVRKNAWELQALPGSRFSRFWRHGSYWLAVHTKPSIGKRAPPHIKRPQKECPEACQRKSNTGHQQTRNSSRRGTDEATTGPNAAKEDFFRSHTHPHCGPVFTSIASFGG
jgi:hypothetical protein